MVGIHLQAKLRRKPPKYLKLRVLVKNTCFMAVELYALVFIPLSIRGYNIEIFLRISLRFDIMHIICPICFGNPN